MQTIIYFNCKIFVYTGFKLEIKSRVDSNEFVKVVMKGCRLFHMWKVYYMQQWVLGGVANSLERFKREALIGAI